MTKIITLTKKEKTLLFDWVARELENVRVFRDIYPPNQKWLKNLKSLHEKLSPNKKGR